MPPKLNDVPKGLRAYFALGMDLEETGGGQARSDCPLCGGERKWFTSAESGLWDCKRCSASGNPLTFLRQLHQTSQFETASATGLARSRGLLAPDTLAKWGMVVSVIDGRWLLPGYDADGRVHQLYRLVDFFDKRTGGTGLRFIPVPGVHADGEAHGFHASVGGWDATKPYLDVFEGPWDGMAAWEVFNMAKDAGENRLALTATVSQSLASKSNAMAVPGASTFPKSWLRLAAGKRVRLWYDSDWPKTVPGSNKEVKAGWDGMRRLASLLCDADEPPESVEVLRWGDGDKLDAGYDANRPDGFDVRDWLVKGRGEDRKPATRVSLLQALLPKMRPMPADWGMGRTAQARRTGGTSLELIPCTSWEELRRSCRKAWKWTDGMDKGMAVGLACIVSTESAGDQLWIKMIGPPSSGKSELCEAWSTNKKYIMPKSTLRGFHSGFDDGSGENKSPLLAMKNKTLVVKDGDTLLKSPNLTQILSEARDIYDRVSRSSYRNSQSMDHEGLNITVILAGTSSLYELDQSELGARFLDCVIMDRIDPVLEREIATRVAWRAAMEMGQRVNGTADSAEGPDKSEAKRTTGGYIDYLRESAQDLLERVDKSESALETCIDLATFVANMRAMPSLKQSKAAEREMCFRLTSQLVRLAACLAVVLNRDRMDDPEVMRRTKQVALDTCRGRTLTYLRHMHVERVRGIAEGINPEELGLATGTLETLSGDKIEDVRAHLRYLLRIGVVKVSPGVVGRVRQQRKYSMTPTVLELYERIAADAGPTVDVKGDLKPLGAS